ncbi:actin-binding Rho-activating protein-like [Clarias gariepinus]|uniref:actin-binding Rho-activating protein-like n=1 Tax=Clarias gariepinus TaxID=13013 RepID=UPI00234CA606|nr:actin-binding Rho-activating protein-like [Clarias gariepinus]XP_053349775.1 actin-binding Rho-activating protein-like [Clarias gariepinus]XP_053349776.1 actin-binding Rho-activating protein-like [Clarias gariepinus]XP_053349777.1 actin-binding Rho-activating protein-like [Clarias gariepinus]
METERHSKPPKDKATSVKGLTQTWQKWSEDHKDYQKHNPFTTDEVLRLDWGQEDYGRPREGSHTERRGKEAHSHIGREVTELCQVIRELGHRREDGGWEVQFGLLFEYYVPISNKLVGILLRARKQGLVQFEGEMLWQGKDDQVLITLLP